MLREIPGQARDDSDMKPTMFVERPMKCVLKLIGGLLVLIIIAAFAIPMFVSADYLKSLYRRNTFHLII